MPPQREPERAVVGDDVLALGRRPEQRQALLALRGPAASGSAGSIPSTSQPARCRCPAMPASAPAAASAPRSRRSRRARRASSAPARTRRRRGPHMRSAASRASPRTRSRPRRSAGVPPAAASSVHSTALSFTSTGSTATPWRCASRTSCAGA